ncbi:hypothetical protein KI387_043696 [Taxus chinensis]|uniref:Uncharacterized protein n=1 Tax=Taxus chinensis TaxID=29808 RepID=A0AA38H3V2_TAXCH|nr:hypothetical protein KI387_043696 [Taxus chinensis]
MKKREEEGDEMDAEDAMDGSEHCNSKKTPKRMSMMRSSASGLKKSHLHRTVCLPLGRTKKMCWKSAHSMKETEGSSTKNSESGPRKCDIGLTSECEGTEGNIMSVELLECEG